MQLEFSRFVESDLDDIAGYIAQDNPRRAVIFIQEIRVKLQEIGRDPPLYQLRPKIGAEARMATLGQLCHSLLGHQWRRADRAHPIRRPGFGGNFRSITCIALKARSGSRSLA